MTDRTEEIKKDIENEKLHGHNSIYLVEMCPICISVENKKAELKGRTQREQEIKRIIEKEIRKFAFNLSNLEDELLTDLSIGEEIDINKSIRKIGLCIDVLKELISQIDKDNQNQQKGISTEQREVLSKTNEDKTPRPADNHSPQTKQAECMLNATLTAKGVPESDKTEDTNNQDKLIKNKISFKRIFKDKIKEKGK